MMKEQKVIPGSKCLFLQLFPWTKDLNSKVLFSKSLQSCHMFQFLLLPAATISAAPTTITKVIESKFSYDHFVEDIFVPYIW